jgi:excisionase family DNA binding protein
MADEESGIEDDLTREENSFFLHTLQAAALEADVEGNLVSHIRGRRSAWTADTLGELLGLSPKSLYKMANEGRIPSYRIGGAVRFDPQITADWLESKSTTNPS